jgi:hypothetical protein
MLYGSEEVLTKWTGALALEGPSAGAPIAQPMGRACKLVVFDTEESFN